MHISELDTPVPVVDYDIACRNIRRLQEYCDANRFKLRPHIKTHKLPLFAHEQCKAGAVGITVQKLGEAEIMAHTGLTDILITYNVMGQEKAERLARLTNFARLSVAIDNEKALQSLAWAGNRARAPIGVLIEFESGGNRQGVQTPGQAVDLAKAVLSHSGVEFIGLMTYPTTTKTAEFLREALPLFRKAGIEVSVISGGGTPNAYRTHELAPVNELRVGTYIYNDRMMMAAQAARLEDCALSVLATVVSRPRSERAVIDAGSKTLSSDLLAPGQGAGYGLLPDYPDASIERLNEEHGVLDLGRSPRKPEIGERVRIIPNHVCVVTNLHDSIYLHRDGAVLAQLSVYLRGKTI
ncbi:MAG: alanine racemase [Verrucomicrobia bacterium]|nr:alanine racemase [Verrucomicrobiota bacterium]